MNVLVYTPTRVTGMVTGTPLRAVNLARALSRQGCQVGLAASGASELSDIAGYDLSPRQGPYPRILWHQVGELVQLIRQLQCDLIYAHTHKGLFPAVFAGKRTGVPVVADIHGHHLEETVFFGGLKRNSLRYGFWQLLERFSIAWSAALTVVSDALKGHFEKWGCRVLVVPGGVDPDLFSPTIAPACEIETWKQGRVTVAYVGNLRYYQGVHMLLESAIDVQVASGHQYCFFLLGNPDEESLYHQWVHQHGLSDSVVFLGRRPYAYIPGYLAAADILVVPRPFTLVSHYAFPSKLAEYISMGRPVVATNVGDHYKAVIDMETGLLVEPTPEALTEALLKLQDPQLRQRLGKGARQHAVQYFAWDKLANDVVGLFQEVLAADVE
jgi:glycosyltransferase involved in cell wall biosynthesis